MPDSSPNIHNVEATCVECKATCEVRLTFDCSAGITFSGVERGWWLCASQSSPCHFTLVVSCPAHPPKRAGAVWLPLPSGGETSAKVAVEAQTFGAALLKLLRSVANAGMSAGEMQDTFWECFKAVKPAEAAEADQRRHNFESACDELRDCLSTQLSMPVAIRRARAAKMREYAEELGIFKSSTPTAASSADDRCDSCKEYDKDGCYGCGPLTIAKVFDPAPDPTVAAPIIDIDPAVSRVFAEGNEEQAPDGPTYMRKYRTARVTPDFSTCGNGRVWWVPLAEQAGVMARLAADGYTVASSGADHAQLTRLCVRTEDALPQLSKYKRGVAFDSAWKVYFVPSTELEEALSTLTAYLTVHGYEQVV